MIPKQIGRYQIKSELGQGGLGAVYLAHDPNFGRDVALKVIAPYLLWHQPEQKEGALKRFRREAQVIGSLEHPAVVPVYDFGEDNGLPFIVMRLMRGGSLRERLDKGKGFLPLDEVVRILEQLAPALDEAHQQGIIHRDIKPHNILFDRRNMPYLADFGIAKLTHASQKFTAKGAVMGTAAYISPEQARGDAHIDGRSDLYSLGATLYHMLTGEHPYHQVHPAALAYFHMNEPVPRLDELRDDLPADSQAIIDCIMAKNPNQRYNTAQEFVTALKRVLTPPIKAQPVAQTIPFATSSPQIHVLNFNLGQLGIGSTKISPKDGMVMVYVPAGPFLMGSANSDPNARDDEKPQRMVYLDGYWIDQTPVTNRMFAKFVAETGYQTKAEKEGWSWVWRMINESVGVSLPFKTQGANWQHPRGSKSNRAGKWDHPVVHVTWHDVQAYCQWVGRRLPTEAEWEKAARSSDGRLYPWGNTEPNDKLLNFNDNISDTTSVGNYPAGASPYSALDMAGNVWEWTADWYDADYYNYAPQRNPQGPVIGRLRINRGGSWHVGAQRVGVGYRSRSSLSNCNDDLGFRCAASL